MHDICQSKIMCTYWVDVWVAAERNVGTIQIYQLNVFRNMEAELPETLA